MCGEDYGSVKSKFPLGSVDVLRGEALSLSFGVCALNRVIYILSMKDLPSVLEHPKVSFLRNKYTLLRGFSTP